MSHIKLIEKRTNELAAILGISDQLEGMTVSQKLADMAIRFSRLNSAAAKSAVANCLEMKQLADQFAA